MLLDFADVTGCNLDVDESRSELKREDKDGKKVSYNPPRYEYSYNFYITSSVNIPLIFLTQIRFQLNSSSVDITPPPAMRPGMTSRCSPETNVEYRNYKKLGEEIRQALDAGAQGCARKDRAGSRAQGGDHLPLLRRDHHAGRKRLL